MTRLLRTGLFLAAACLSAPIMADAKWLTDYSKATALSKKTGKPILANFTGSDWCHWCEVLHKEVFAKKDFKAWAAKNVILLELDFPDRKKLSKQTQQQNEALAKKYDVHGYPTILFLKSDGTKIGRSGYMPGGPAKWIEHAKGVLKKS